MCSSDLGVIGDLGGFAASVYQRGIPYVQVPTTVLSQVDSSVGGKTGVNLKDAKHMVGTFHQPAHVFADVDTLKSLPKREWNEGFAEIIKHAAIRDASMFDVIDQVAQGKGDAAGNGEMGEQRVVLEHHADLAGVRRQRLAGTADALAAQMDFTLPGGIEAGDQPQYRGLAATRGAQQAADLAFLQMEGNTAQHGFLAEAMAEFDHFQGRGHG